MVFPQAEHARLAGELALAWGNDAFPRPPLPFASFVAGVTLHDRGYGELDADGIGEVESERWVAIQRAGFAPRGDDPVVDLVVGLHIRRLLSPPQDAYESAALVELNAALPSLLAAAGVDGETAAAADRITQVCDTLAFEFCFERPASGTVGAISYALDGRGGIRLEPWPLAVPKLTGIVLAYRGDGYPERLDPVVVPFEASP